MSGQEIRIVGEDGTVVGAGLTGEIQVRGANVMKGYQIQAWDPAGSHA